MAGDPTPAPLNMPPERFPVDFTGEKTGPTLVVIAGLHGDEVGSINALSRVRARLDELAPSIRGRIVGVLGNLAAIHAGQRYLARDLNRRWHEDEVAAIQAQRPEDDSPEDREARELIAFFASLDDEPNRPVIFLDLHSTSADGLPFSCMPDTLANLRIALELPIPSILGLEETINGPLTGLMSDRGYRSVIVEGGRHDRENTAEILESCVWVLLVALRMLARTDLPDYGSHWNRLADLGQGLPRVLEIIHRHETHPDDGFQMQPGFEHYHPVIRGQVLARDERGEILSPHNGRIIMPAYKPGTDQGFFIARDVPRLFVWTLFLLRRMHLDKFCHLLPGTRRVPDHLDMLEVSSWVPEWLINVIRLLGWRRTWHDDDRTLLRRRSIRR